MNTRDKIAAALAYLERRGVSQSHSAPFHYRILWVFGLYVRPPHFQSALGLFLFNAISFGVILSGVVLAFERHTPLELMVYLGPPGGVLIGLILVVIYRFKAWQLGLPPWSEFPPDRGYEDGADGGW